MPPFHHNPSQPLQTNKQRNNGAESNARQDSKDWRQASENILLQKGQGVL